MLESVGHGDAEIAEQLAAEALRSEQRQIRVARIQRNPELHGEGPLEP